MKLALITLIAYSTCILATSAEEPAANQLLEAKKSPREGDVGDLVVPLPYLAPSGSSLDDYSHFSAFYPDVGIDGPTPTFEEWLLWVQPTQSLVMLSFVKEPIGYILPIYYGDNYYLLHFMVAKERRGQGIGRHVMNAMIRDARERGFSKFSLDCDVTHKRIYAFYESFGMFVVYKEFTYKIAFDDFDGAELASSGEQDPIVLPLDDDTVDAEAFPHLDKAFGCFDGYHALILQNKQKLYLVYTGDGVVIGSLYAIDGQTFYLRSLIDASGLEGLGISLEDAYGQVLRASQAVFQGRREELAGTQVYLWVRNNPGQAKHLQGKLGSLAEQTSEFDYLEKDLQ